MATRFTQTWANTSFKSVPLHTAGKLLDQCECFSYVQRSQSWQSLCTQTALPSSTSAGESVMSRERAMTPTIGVVSRRIQSFHGGICGAWAEVTLDAVRGAPPTPFLFYEPTFGARAAVRFGTLHAERKSTVRLALMLSRDTCSPSRFITNFLHVARTCPQTD